MAQTLCACAIGAAHCHPLAARHFAPVIQRMQRTGPVASKLVRGQPLIRGPVGEHDMKLNRVTVDNFSKPHEAHLAKLRLDSAGIDSIILDENIVSVNPLYSTAVGGIKLTVNAEDENEAKRILKEYREEQKEYEKTIEKQCPKCGSENIGRNMPERLFLIIFCIMTAWLYWLLFGFARIPCGLPQG
jgi:hypothetical protein